MRYVVVVLCTILTLHAADAPELIKRGRMHTDVGNFTQAIECYRTANTLTMNYVQLFELAHLMANMGLFNEAAEIYQRMLAAVGPHAELYHNLGYCLRCAGRFAEAIIAYKEALTCDPKRDATHLGLTMAYIFQGDYAHGWQLHERFLRSVGRNADRLRSWLATDSCVGKTVLLKPEGGLGDTFQFVRYARELKKYGLTVIVATQPPLYNVLSRCPFIDHLIATNETVKQRIDDWTTLMSMAPILFAHEHKLPEFSVYLSANPELVKQWAAYFAHDTNFKVGISWQASVHNDASRPAVARRGMPLKEFYILQELPHITLYSLQQEDGLEQLADLPSHVNIKLFDATFDKTQGAFEDSAAVLEHLDLLITVDSALAHLAGGMGKEVWLLLPYATDWRWVHNATTSAWYPHMRIFKQAAPFDWQEVMERVFVALAEKIAKQKL